MTGDRPLFGVKNDLGYIINVKNNGPSPSSDVTLSATLPAGVNFSSASASQGLPCSPPASGVVTCDLQAMAKDAQATVTIFVVPQNTGTIQMTTSVQIASDETDPDNSNDSATVTTDVVDNPATHSADLSISLSGSPNPVTAGTTLTYTMTMENKGPESATGVIAVLSLPASVTVSSPGSGCSKDSQTNIVRCELSNTLNSGGSAQATVGVTPSQAGVIKATASASFIGSDPDTTNNTATLSTTVDAAPSSGGSSGGGGGGDMDPLTLLAMLALWISGARNSRRRGI